MVICFPPTPHHKHYVSAISGRLEVMGDRRNPRSRRLRLDSPEDREFLLSLLESSDEEEIFQEDIESDDQFSDISSDESDISDIEEDISSDNSDSDSSDVGNAASTHGGLADDVWSWVHDASYSPPTLDFDTSSSGIQPECPILDDSPELDYYLMFFDNNVMEIIRDETNRYHQQKMRDTVLGRTSVRRKWKDTTVEELYVFLALSLLMPHVYKGDVNDYWSTDPLIRTDIFGKTMPRDRYLLLLRSLHFADNDTRDRSDRLSVIRPVLSPLLTKFKSFFKPFQNLVIDESLVLFKGRLAFKQYIRTKRARFGIKLFVLCCCETGYILDLMVYLGKKTEIVTDSKLGVSGSVVKTMMTDYVGLGHCLYTDNWYTSPTLAKFLLDNKTQSCGTVRSNRAFMPKFRGKLSRGEHQSFTSNQILCVKWHDKRDVVMCSSKNRDRMVDSGKRHYSTNEAIMKPEAVLDYNENMRLVDKSDMQIGIVETTRKTTKWYRKLFLHLIDVSILNAYNLYLVKSGNKPRLKNFRLAVIRQMLAKYGTDRSNVRRVGRRSAEQSPMRLSARHFVEALPPTEKKRSAQRQCYVCANTKRRPKRRKDTHYWCKDCEIPLCIEPCFKTFHTVSNF